MLLLKNILLVQRYFYLLFYHFTQQKNIFLTALKFLLHNTFLYKIRIQA